MDPTANLAELRRLIERFNKAQDIGEPLVDMTDAYRMAELIEALDEWISRGCYLPTQWTQK